MIRQLKPIGTYSERQARRYLRLGLLLLIPFMLLCITSIPRLPFYIDMGRFELDRGFLMGTFSTLGIIFIVLPYGTYKSGLTGERNVVRNISDKLDRSYSIFNDVLLKDGKWSGNVDHIVIGPTGIFAVETKNNKGNVSYDGYRWTGIKGNPSGQAVSNSIRIKNVLKNCEVFIERPPYVNAVLVFTNNKINLTLSKDPEWCKVFQIRKVTDSSLSDYIKNEPIRFSNKEIASIEESLKIRIGNYDE